MATVSFIVSAFNRPESLNLCLASLRCQSCKDFDILVTDNAEDDEIAIRHRGVSELYEAWYMGSRKRDCYESANFGAENVTGEYLCFPSDDGIYFPLFLDFMLRHGRRGITGVLCEADVIYCDQVWAGPSKHGGMECDVLRVEPERGKIDKGGFLMRRGLFQRLGGFKGPWGQGRPADGWLIEEAVKAGASLRKVGIVGWVHN